jgi:hypothetical protein
MERYQLLKPYYEDNIINVYDIFKVKYDDFLVKIEG